MISASFGGKLEMPIPILVVDDEPNFQALMQSALGKRGFLVNAVSSGAAEGPCVGGDSVSDRSH